jgi:hypothetical protein
MASAAIVGAGGCEDFLASIRKNSQLKIGSMIMGYNTRVIFMFLAEQY